MVTGGRVAEWRGPSLTVRGNRTPEHALAGVGGMTHAKGKFALHNSVCRRARV